MCFFDSTKSTIENIYFLSGPVIALLSLAVIYQIRIAKKAIIVNSKRQAAELAAKQIEIYNNQIIPLQDEFDKREKTEKIPNPILKNVKNFNRNELERIIGKEEVIKVLKSRINFSLDNLKVLNAMEAFATYFTKGVADEAIGFNSVGLTFCNHVEKCCFDISFARDDFDDIRFINIVQLYDLWKSKIKAKKISKELQSKIDEYKALNIENIDILGIK